MKFETIQEAEDYYFANLAKTNNMHGEEDASLERCINSVEITNEEKLVKLYELPRDSKILIHAELDGKQVEYWVTFRHIDGMYSYCTDDDGGVMHLSAGTLLKKVDEHYELIETKR